MKKWKRRTGQSLSMKIPLVLCFLLVTLLPLLFQSRILTGLFRQSQIEEQMIDAQNKCLMITNKIMSSDYIAGAAGNTGNPALDAELNVTADLFNGRIVVISRDFKIIRDTFELSRGKSSVVEEVLKAFDGETTVRLNNEKGYFYLTVPIYEKADSGNADPDKIQGVLLMSASTGNSLLLEEQVMRKTGFFQFVLICLVAVIDVILVTFLMKPFKNLQTQLDLVAEGNLEQDIYIDSYKETTGISQSVSRTLKKLKAVDQSRQEFVSNVSHELKTPITSIRVLADSLMGMEDAPAELYREFLNDISVEIDREGKIIDDLLALVKMDKSSPDLNIASISINELLEQILKRLGPIAKKRNVELIYESIREVKADVDEVKLSLALSNLVENAVKYNSEDGWVRVVLDADHKFFYVKVSDNGIGIAPEFQEHVFERFYRVDKARSRETGGTGLGLAITKSIVNLHQGAIKLQSKEGEGAVFTVRIPLNYIP